MATAKGPKRKPRINKNPNVVPQENNGGSLSPEVIAAFQSRNDEAESEVRGKLGELMSYLQNAGGRAYENIGRADDAVQGFIRNKVYGLPEDGSVLSENADARGLRHAMGKIMHRSRADAHGDTHYRGTGTMNDNIGIVLSRAAQAGALTGAGASLLNLTHMYQNQFGQPADAQSATELPLGY